MMDYIRNPGDKNFAGYGHYHEDYLRCPDGKWRIAKVVVIWLHLDQLGEIAQSERP